MASKGKKKTLGQDGFFAWSILCLLSFVCSSVMRCELLWFSFIDKQWRIQN